MKDLVIFGTGGIGRQVIQMVADINAVRPTWRLVGLVDDNGERHGDVIHDVPVVGGSDWLQAHSGCHVVIAVGNPRTRRAIAERLRTMGHERFASIVHPSVWIGAETVIGEGTIVYPGVLIDTDVKIGIHGIVNKACTVGHDAVLADFVTVAPGVNLGGNIQIGTGSDLGIGCSIIQGITIGDDCIVGAGAVVIRDVPDGATVVGVPAKPI